MCVTYVLMLNTKYTIILNNYTKKIFRKTGSKLRVIKMNKPKLIQSLRHFVKNKLKPCISNSLIFWTGMQLEQSRVVLLDNSMGLTELELSTGAPKFKKVGAPAKI